ncbi:ArsR/SmtB family transcription factor [Jiangella alkaliphila]|uniref:DNA-binding transcriptional regulator, ArsR family n=1 Tax=Jiangella alkaliphila TaxID=419479 RepID=A0A1H2KYC1_9ACTN|nr:metalloregulator ArsR/SmtB family transcription factor [Jiangella alkaliphila]SDU73777.1 DNA-binding transcriptional regulator, ArsR family [Jiangella alkaliphila]
MLDQQPNLDLVFQALADPTRRALVERMTHGPASASELARPFEMTLAAILQHMKVLEVSGLVRTTKEGRVRMCRIEPGALRTAEDWIAERRTSWERKLDRLGALLEDET